MYGLKLSCIISQKEFLGFQLSENFFIKIQACGGMVHHHAQDKNKS